MDTTTSIYNPVYGRRVNSLALVFSLSSHRHSYIGLIFSSRFTLHNKQTAFLQVVALLLMILDNITVSSCFGQEVLRDVHCGLVCRGLGQTDFAFSVL